ncbi:MULTISPECIES: DUF5919 domain-containing protein [unclassified Paenibacillus]|uniref:DUF5919 domain-containing protein n=1 Tax=unclassified Paenibacillus TaxID=185978 RepID=UPI000B8922CD|nr:MULTISPECIES: DUF5919 domain-containing protein [unclassified Paenibacillus]QLG42076.1 hypothetical protein HW560_30800 [Paenibacillus sp. E222]
MEKNKNELLVYIVVLLLGVIAIVSGQFLGNTINGIFTSIGTSILASAIIYFLLNHFVGSPILPIVSSLQKLDLSLKESVELLNQTSKVGLIGIWSRRMSIDNEIWIKKIKESKSTIDILGYAVHFLPEHYEFNELIETKNKEGCRIRILLGKPDGYYIKARNEEEKNEGSISDRIKTTLARLSPLLEQGFIEIRLHDAPLYNSIYKFDSEMLVTPHLYGLRGAAAPLMNLKEIDKGIFEIYNKHFEDIWSISEDYSLSKQD